MHSKQLVPHSHEVHQEKIRCLFSVVRKLWCCRKAARERSVYGCPKWIMRLVQSNTWKKQETNDSRVEIHHIHCCLSLPLLVSRPVSMCGTGCKQLGNLPCLCGALMYLLSNYCSNFTCIPRIWLPLFIKSQTLNCTSPGYAQLHTVIYMQRPLRKWVWLSEYNWSLPPGNNCLITRTVKCIFRNAIKDVVLLMHATFFFKISLQRCK